MRCTIPQIFNILIISLLLSFSPNPAQTEVIDRIVAQVGEKIITLHDIQMYAPAVVRQINAIENPDERRRAWQRHHNDTLMVMIEATTLEVAAARIGVNITPSMVDEAIVRVQEQNTVFREHVRRIIEREGDITPEVRLYIRNLLIQSEVARNLAPRAIVTEQDIRNFLRDDPNIQFGETSYNVSLVFLPDSLAYDKFALVLQNSAFEDAAMAVEQPIIDMGWITSNQLIPEMADVVEQMLVGDVSPAFVDMEGRHVVLKLTDTKTDSSIPDNVRNYAANMLREAQMENVYANWLDRNKRSILVTRY